MVDFPKYSTVIIFCLCILSGSFAKAAEAIKGVGGNR